MIKAVIFDLYETLISLECGIPYFGPQMAIDAGISEERFLPSWLSSKKDRTIGKCSLEEIVATILKNNDRYSEELLSLIVNKRTAVNKKAFENIHPEIFPMIQEIKHRGLKIGLISNCFSEEVAVIKRSDLFPLFDSSCLSFEEGVSKPNPKIYIRCIQKLGIKFEECLYIGDGDCNELTAAKRLGMNVIQATWYIDRQFDRTENDCIEIPKVDSPVNVIRFIDLQSKMQA